MGARDQSLSSSLWSDSVSEALEASELVPGKRDRGYSANQELNGIQLTEFLVKRHSSFHSVSNGDMSHYVHTHLVKYILFHMDQQFCPIHT